MARVELPSDGWAELADPATVSEKKRRPVTRQSIALRSIPGADAVFAGDGEVTPELLDALNDLNDALVVALVESWSYPEPVTIDGLLSLPGPVYDKLREAAAPHVVGLLPNFEPNPEPTSPT